LAAFPGSLQQDLSEKLARRLKLAILSDPERIQKLRKRLGSLSWFMKALNEAIARVANLEDGCPGRTREYLVEFLVGSGLCCEHKLTLVKGVES